MAEGASDACSSLPIKRARTEVPSGGSTNSIKIGNQSATRDIYQLTTGSHSKVKITTAEFVQKQLKIDRAKNILQESYKQLNLPNVPWLAEGTSFGIDSFYVQLQLSHSENIVPLEDIFKNTNENQQSQVKRILIEGQPGYGKTTLCHKLAYDWATAKPYTKQFNLAFLVVLSRLDGSTISECVNDEIDGENEKETWDAINDEKTLLILDGLDELGGKERSSVLRTLYERKNRMMIVVTSRTGQFKLTQKDKKIFTGKSIKSEFQDKLIEILGINDENRREFLSKFIQNENKDTILENVERVSQRVSEIFESPLLLILLTYVIEECDDVKIETKTDLYKILCNCIVRRSVSRKTDDDLGPEFSLFNSRKLAKEKIYVDVFVQFGKLSLEHLCQNKLMFDAGDICDRIYEMGFLRKFLVKKSTFKIIPRYVGFHLSVIEFSAAFALWFGYKDSNCSFTDEAIEQINLFLYKNRSFSLVIPFLCDLLGDNAIMLFERLSQYSAIYSTDESDSRSLEFVLKECKMDEKLHQCIFKFFFPIYKYEFSLHPYKGQIFQSFLNRFYPVLNTDKYQCDFEKFAANGFYGGLVYLQIHSYEMCHLPENCAEISIHVEITDEMLDKALLCKRVKCKRIFYSFGAEVNNLETIEKYLSVINSVIAEKISWQVTNKSLFPKLLQCLQKLSLKPKIHELYCKLSVECEENQFVEKMKEHRFDKMKEQLFENVTEQFIETTGGQLIENMKKQHIEKLEEQSYEILKMIISKALKDGLNESPGEQPTENVVVQTIERMAEQGIEFARELNIEIKRDLVIEIKKEEFIERMKKQFFENMPTPCLEITGIPKPVFENVTLMQTEIRELSCIRISRVPFFEFQREQFIEKWRQLITEIMKEQLVEKIGMQLIENMGEQLTETAELQLTDNMKERLTETAEKHFIEHVIKEQKLETLTLLVTVGSLVLKCCPKNRAKFFLPMSKIVLDSILNIAAQSNHVKKLTIGGVAEVDLDRIVELNRHLELTLQDVVITCGSNIANPQRISSFTCRNRPILNDREMRSIVPVKLRCNRHFIFSLCRLSSWEGLNSVRELTLYYEKHVPEERDDRHTYLYLFFFNLSLFTQVEIFTIAIVGEFHSDELYKPSLCPLLEKIRELRVDCFSGFIDSAFCFISNVVDLINKQRLKSLVVLNINFFFMLGIWFEHVDGTLKDILDSVFSCVKNKNIRLLRIESLSSDELHTILQHLAGKRFGNMVKFNIQHTVRDCLLEDYKSYLHTLSISLVSE